MGTITEDLETLLSLEPELAARAALSMHGPELDVEHTRGWAAYVRIAVAEYHRVVAEAKELTAEMGPEIEKSYTAILKINAVKNLLSTLRMLADTSPSQLLH